MVHFWTRHKVADFDRWKAVFDDYLMKRKAGGEISSRVFQSQDDANDVFGFFEWSSRAAAEEFFSMPATMKAMSESGVVGEVQVVYLQEARRVRRTAAD